MSEFIKMAPANQGAVNYFRLTKLTMAEGTVAIRRAVLDRLPGGQTLHMVLRQKEEKIRSLSRGQCSVISNRQLAILYPSDSNCDLSAIDMTLWCVLARNIVPLPKGVSVNWGDDDHPPLPGQNQWFHDVVRIRLTRNNLFHLQRAEVDDDTFNQLWNYIAGPLRRLDPTIDLDLYRHAEYDRAAAREFEIQVKEQVFYEMNEVLKAGLAERRKLFIIISVIGLLLLALIAVTMTIVYYQVNKETVCGALKRFEIIDPFGVLTFMPREGWNAEKADKKSMANLVLPVQFVEYTHTTDVTQCSDCCAQVYNIQYQHMHHRGWGDIGLHFLIDSSGLVYGGRSVKYVPAAVKGWNTRIISIGLIGNFMYETPKDATLSAMNMLIQWLVKGKYVTSNFTLYGMCEISSHATDSPGKNLYRAVNTNAGNYESFRHVGHRPEGKCTFKFSESHLDETFEL